LQLAAAKAPQLRFAGGADLHSEGRIVETDHGAFVLINVYAPNAGERPARARLPFKLRWFAALRDRLDKWEAQGREVMLVGDLNIPRSRKDVHPAIQWDGLYSSEVCVVLFVSTVHLSSLCMCVTSTCHTCACVPLSSTQNSARYAQGMCLTDHTPPRPHTALVHRMSYCPCTDVRPWSHVSRAQELGVVAALAGCLHDVWREDHPTITNEYTVWDERKNARATNCGLRIDYVLLSAGLRAQCRCCEIMGDLPQVLLALGLEH
jgi:exonuclease III